MELKYRKSKQDGHDGWDSNRTLMELKYGTQPRKSWRRWILIEP